MQLKYLIALTVTVVTLVSFSAVTPKHLRHLRQAEDIFAADSGFIKKDAAIKLLLQTKYDLGYEPEGRDTTDVVRSDIKANDSLGRYYRLANGDYLGCVHDVIHPDRISVLVLMQFSPDGKVRQAEPFFGGMHFCCWDKHYDTLAKHNDGYFSITTCGTGSGHCSSYIHLFKGFGSQGSGICSYIWSGWCKPGRKAMLACHLSSKMEIKNDEVIMHYTMEHLQERRNGKYKTVFAEKFDVTYIGREHDWVALDSTKI